MASLLSPAGLTTSARAASPLEEVSRETPVVRAVRRVSASVVNIHGQKTVRGTAAGFAGAPAETMRQVNGMGTGIIIDPRGYLITNYHVVEDVSDIRVTLADKRTATAEQIAHDVRYDLAVLKISIDEPLEVVPLGTSQDLMVGERVIAIGNAFGYENTVTEGIISALHRDVPVNDQQEYRDLIQTSAGINPGNSGGPLLNIRGDVIGINVAVRVGAQSIAFAIPIDQAIQVSRNLIREYNEQHVTLGLAGTIDSDSPAQGLLVTSLAEGGPGVRGGLQAGDRILKIGDRAIDDPLDFELAILGIEPGQRIGLNVQRGEEQTALELQASEPSYASDSRGIATRIWSVVGIQAEPLSPAAVRQLNGRLRIDKPYKGGLRITAVRPGSPADRQLIRSGDVLLGIHGWQTASIDDLDLILRSPEMRTTTQAEFYIVRRDQTLVGQLRLAQGDQARLPR
ncbi:trypsin-like peptidase domain-containing protein [Candidatus Laterigemmans baculatus]|uniref:trypsin-like peptidase domain-containing protein n=1 Tax=Candidatus Laterigemmans baculatus TaxID=2770505 RepID=UPI0028F45070|nr:trypsin-like peptidase domain-containing protein [Candidatus Laterigemmans baculatus]